jgi:hypothetical protein
MTIVKGLTSKILDWFLTEEISPIIFGLKLIFNYIGLFTPWQGDLEDSQGSNQRLPSIDGNYPLASGINNISIQY